MLDKVIEWLAIKGENDEELSKERVIALALIIISDCPEYMLGKIDDKMKLLAKVVCYIDNNKEKVDFVMKES
jgi:hypothetical protein